MTKKYPQIARKREQYLLLFGNCCMFCFSNKRLEFAHTRETELSSIGRGSNQRIIDVMHNLDAYLLLCHDCHQVFDREGSLVLNVIK